MTEFAGPDRLKECARRAPDLVAFVLHCDAEERVLTYGDWWHQVVKTSRKVARYLGPSRHIALCLDNRRWLEYAYLYFGIQLAGGIPVPISSRVSTETMQRIARETRLQHVIHGQGEGQYPLVDELTYVHWNVVTSRAGTGPSAGADPSFQSYDLDAPAEVLYTSGTTGVPRGVVSTYGHMWTLEGQVDPIPAAVPQQPPSVLHASPIGSHMAQLMLYLPLRSAYSVAITLARWCPTAFGRLVQKYQVVTAMLVPSMLATLTDVSRVEEYDLSSLETLVSSGAPIAEQQLAELRRCAPNSKVINAYTTTEVWPAGTSIACEPDHLGSVGRASDGSIRIVSEDGDVLPRGEVGRVQFAAVPNHSRYYIADSSGEVVGQEWVSTDDEGYIGDDGYLYLFDRISDVVNSGGTKVSTLLIENALFSDRSVLDTACFGAPHPTLGEVAIAAVVCGNNVDCNGILERCREKLGIYESPRVIWRIPEIPRNDAGKVDKKQLRTQYGERSSDRQQAELTELENDLLAITRSVVAAVAASDDDLIAAGADSFSIVTLLSLFEDELNIVLSLDEMLALGSVRRIAARVTGPAYVGDD